jgi:Na+-translocating ferredoxin:NAD+ oxidoreductase subunit B
MNQQTHLKRHLKQVAHIREAECIGCTKCLQACPFDAIIGSTKQLHTILDAECTGCGLCVAPCPVDCIDLLPVKKSLYDPVRAQQRLEARNRRVATASTPAASQPGSSLDLKSEIQAAVARAKAKKQDLAP